MPKKSKAKKSKKKVAAKSKAKKPMAKLGSTPRTQDPPPPRPTVRDR